MVRRWNTAWRGLIISLTLGIGMALIFWESVEIGFYAPNWSGAAGQTAAVSPQLLDRHFLKLESLERHLVNLEQEMGRMRLKVDKLSTASIATTMTEISSKSTAVSSPQVRDSSHTQNRVIAKFTEFDTPPTSPPVDFKPLDQGQKNLRKYMRSILQQPMHQHSLAYVPAKHILSSVGDQDGYIARSETVDWVMSTVCEHGKGPSCTEACEAQSWTCDVSALSEVTSEEAMAKVVRSAGKDCSRFLEHQMDGEWDGPWRSEEAICGYNNKPTWEPTCGVKPNCGWIRVCPCRIPPGHALPSKRRELWKEYHKQWDHDCSRPWMPRNSTGNASRIPRHFHVVVIQDRSVWVNRTEPSLLISEHSREYKSMPPYNQLLLENMRLAIAINLFDSVHFLDDDACVSALRQWSDPNLLRVFLAESDLRYKADICRIAALYLEGGYYFDDDMLSYAPVVPLIQKETEIATAIGVSGSEIFQSFLAAVPCHPVLRRNMEMLSEARPARGHSPKKYDGLLGPVTLKMALDELHPAHVQYLHEVKYNPYQSREERGYDVAPEIGYQCEHAVMDKRTGKLVFCSRF